MSTEIPRYEVISASSESTVVAEFEMDLSAREPYYQSEADLEYGFIRQLEGQAYERLCIRTETDLINNLRTQLAQLNGVEFSDSEWGRFFKQSVTGASAGIVEKTARIQQDHIQVLTRDDGTTKNIHLIDKKNIHNNRLQVINQYEATGTHANRYDVTILVNGLPMVHVELKRRGVDLREAFNQIERYQRDSFWAGSGLFQYVQLFVISNGTHTKYYSNTTRNGHLEEQRNRKPGRRRTSNSFAFTSWWADARNRLIQDLVAFTSTFFAKHTLLNILTRYCVFDAKEQLMVMRPYQIVAAERIIQRIRTSSANKQLGTVQAGGYVWHTTGSGKTLTSFKTAQLACGLDGVDKVLFVVDRKDLDFQTMQEYDRFEKGAASSNTSTAMLAGQLDDPKARIIVTTIQKLNNFVSANPKHEVYGKHVVIIFDECHRTQFGDMHDAITRAFRQYNLFGFTGTPIFVENASSSGNPKRRTTPQTFGDRLHAYTIVDAIGDRNVLPFRVDYISTVQRADDVEDREVSAIDAEKALLAPERIEMVTKYILEHFDQKTLRSGGGNYSHNGRKLNGFNSLLATASIPAAQAYYRAFKALQAALPQPQRLKVGLIYSFAPNGDSDDADGQLAEEGFEADALDGSARDFLEGAIADYNAMFGMSFNTSAQQFESYYKDLSKRLKERDLDLVIVVNMFLTGFDATTLNTLWVDKNLKAHGLIQAFSRTNRILNSVKAFGNIVCFRNLEKAANEALTLFGNPDAQGVVLLKPYADYYAEYAQKVQVLLERFPVGQPIVGGENEKAFIDLFGAILRLKNILTAFDEFEGQQVLSDRDFQDYQSQYLDLWAEFRERRGAEKASIVDDVVFEIELIKQVEINVDYILALVAEYLKVRGTGKDREIKATIDRAVGASPSLRSKKDLIDEFVARVSSQGPVGDQWQQFIAERRDEELEQIIDDEKLRPVPTRALVNNALRDGVIPASGTAITDIMPRVSRFHGAEDGEDRYSQRKRRVFGKLGAHVERFAGLAAPEEEEG